MAKRIIPQHGKFYDQKTEELKKVFDRWEKGRENQNSEDSITLMPIADKVASNIVRIPNTKYLPRIYCSRFGKSHRKL